VVLAALILRGSILPPIAPWIAATGTPTFLTIPSETAKLVTGLVCRNIVALSCGETHAEVTSVSTKRFTGTNTYCVALTTTGLPE
jgi:hypothetical protein